MGSETLVTEVNLTDALLVYRGTGAMETVYIERAAVMERDGQAHLASPSPLVDIELRRFLAEIFPKRERDNQCRILPDQILAAGVGPRAPLVFWIPPERRGMFFSVGGRRDDLDVMWPGLVVGVVPEGNRSAIVYVTMVKGKQKPQHKTVLYHAPLWNLNSDCRLCTGSAKLPASASMGVLPAWSEVVTQSVFTHGVVNDTLQLWGRKNLYVFWKRLARSGVGVPSRLLRPTGYTLESFVKKLNKIGQEDRR